jgi:hypothetical protein
MRFAPFTKLRDMVKKLMRHDAGTITLSTLPDVKFLPEALEHLQDQFDLT